MRMFLILLQRIVVTTFLVLLTTDLWSQNITVVKKRKIYRQQVINDSNHRMVELKSKIPAVIYDLQYATTRNFTGRKLYNQSAATYLRLPVAKALDSVHSELMKAGYGLKIFDAYRPYRVTKKMWELIRDERYVANPAKGSGHNRGLSVDLTLIDLTNGEELNMGTGFDDFSEKAHHDFRDLTPSVLLNRRRLKEVMERFGFKALSTEWWHYSWPNDRKYDVLDLEFKELR
jgi:D-alanyl-D-alanine dipeptidase